MKKFALSNNWKMRQCGEEQWLTATVPGSVYSDYMNAGRLNDPFWRDNEDAFYELMKNDFEYQCDFDISDELFSKNHLILRCEGLDTLAEITLNGVTVASTDNMHRTWEFNIKNIVRKKGNTLNIVFRSSLNFITEEQKKFFCDGSIEALSGMPHIRKAHYMFGWDWGPYLIDAGIWRELSLIGYDEIRLSDIEIRQKHTNGVVEISVIPEFEGITDGFDIGYSLIYPNGTTVHFDDGKIRIENPELWWPNGYGAQPLYTVTVEIKKNGSVVDTLSKKIGLRTITLSMQDDEYGQEFAFVVNGIKIFAMGANYIPQDNIISRVNKERTSRLLKDCVDANFNMLRVWGGGYYPDDELYELCDEYGILIWQDMMFACGAYRLTDSFEENIKCEIRDNIKRFRHHACLALICGNNEIEDIISHGGYKTTHKQLVDYHTIFERIIPEGAKKYAPDIPYRPSSPSSGGYFDEANDFNRGDVHYWYVWHGGVPFSEYRKYYFRFCSEFGFQSFPSMKTIESFTLPKDRNLFSYIMEKHQRNNGANSRILQYMEQLYELPMSMDSFVYYSQLLQADAIKYGVEHWRRNRGRCMGATYWQLNDCWPVASWSSIDYYGRWKMLHYAAKRFFAPILLSCEEEGLLTQNSNVNMKKDIEKSIRLNVSNETSNDIEAEIVWSIRTADSTVIREERETVNVKAYSAEWLDKVILDEMDISNEHIRYDMYIDGKWISGSSVLLTLPKIYDFKDPKFNVSVSGDTVTVTSCSYAKGVWITNENDDLVLSDNGFDMEKGSISIKIIRGDLSKLTVRSINF